MHICYVCTLTKYLNSIFVGIYISYSAISTSYNYINVGSFTYICFYIYIGNEKKVMHLLELPNAKTHLSLWKADLLEDGSFDDVIQGCQGVFHVANPPDIMSSSDPEVPPIAIFVLVHLPITVLASYSFFFALFKLGKF